MFGSTSAFGQSSSSPFGSQSVFGQTSNASNNPFAPKPFGTTAPFGSQTGGSIFGGTSTGMFGAPQTSSPFSSAATFGASSSPAFGGSVPAFGASSTPAFGSSSSFGGPSVFGQKPAFGGFGSTTQTSPFGSTSQQSQPAFGSGLFGSTTPFGTSSQPAFSATSSPGFGSTSTPGFGSTSTSAFGASNTMGFGANSTSAFGVSSTPTFGSTGSAFGVSSPVFGSGAGFGSSSTSAFGTSTSSGFGASGPAFGTSSSAPGFGVTTSSPAFGSTPSFGSTTFGTSTTSPFSFSSGPSFGQSSSAFASSPFGATTSPFSSQSSSFAQATTPTFGGTGFGQSAFAGNRGGSRVVPYSATAETDNAGGQPGKLESISAMPVYKDKSHEELRWEDYQLGDKGGPLAPGQSSGGISFAPSAPQSNPFAPSATFTQSSSSPFSSSVPSNPFSAKPFGTTSISSFTTSPFTVSSSPFQSTPAFSSTSSSAFTPSVAPSPFGSSSAPAFASTPSLFTSTTGQTSPSPFGNLPSAQSSLFPSTTPSSSPFGQATTAFTPSSGSSFAQSSIFNTPSTGFGFTQSLLPSTNQGLFSQPSLSQSAPFQMSQPSQPSSTLSFSNFGQPQAAGTTGFAGSSSIFGQTSFGPLSATQGSVAVQLAPVTNPFGTLPAMPQMSIGRVGTTPSVQYGISSLPVVDKPSPVRISSLLTSRHLSQRRIKLPARKYNPKHDGPKVPFFSDEEESTGTPKADALFIPRENPRALVIRPTDQWPLRSSAEKAPPLKESSTPAYENGKISDVVDVPSSSGSGAGGKAKNMVEDGFSKERVNSKLNQKLNGVHEDNSAQKEEMYMTLSGHRAGEAAIVYEHGADIEAQMPKLRRSDYYTEPRIQELAAKERAEPGFCRHVKDFVVGRHGYGSIKFLGETDVRRLDLESVVQFNNREVIVYTDDSKKPPVGQGLNKPAEVTLLNIKCFDKKTGRQYTEGLKIEKYKEMLKRKAEDQGAEFVSYDPVKGEWKFRVNHFSKYNLGDEEEDDNDEDDWFVLSARDC